MKLPTMSVGMPYGSRRIVIEKQQLMKPSSSGGGCVSLPRAGVTAPDAGSRGLNRSTHDVSTAFWFESNATLPYFCAGGLVSRGYGHDAMGWTDLPVVDCGVFRHELIYAQASLPAIMPSALRAGPRIAIYTYVSEHIAVHADEFRKLAVRLVDFAGAAP